MGRKLWRGLAVSIRPLLDLQVGRLWGKSNCSSSDTATVKRKVDEGEGKMGRVDGERGKFEGSP